MSLCVVGKRLKYIFLLHVTDIFISRTINKCNFSLLSLQFLFHVTNALVFLKSEDPRKFVTEFEMILRLRVQRSACFYCDFAMKYLSSSGLPDSYTLFCVERKTLGSCALNISKGSQKTFVKL